MRKTFLVLPFLLAPLAARAGDGVLEINATCAASPGCFAGDDPGYPVTITTAAGGSSFRLTSDLVVPNETTGGISVGMSNVTIDLAGFSIIRSACVGATSSCVPATGSGSGVSVFPPSLEHVSVRGGSVVGMAGAGVQLGDRSEVLGVRARWNRFDGVVVGKGSILTGCSAAANGGNGIRVDEGSKVSGSTATGNGSTGISASGRSTISGNASSTNASDGIFCGEACVIDDNAVAGNAGRGIRALNGSRVARNVVRSNGLVGIAAGQSSVIEANTVSANGGSGISTGFLAQIVDNGLDGNGGTAIEASDGSNVSRNTVGPITASFASFVGITCGSGCAVHDNVVRNSAQAMVLGAGSRYGRNVLTLTPSPAVVGSGVSAGDNLCDATSC